MKPVKHIVTAGLATLAFGCSVASIDVDVYKGPLADHEDVQVQQMASMAIAARPLLIRLRDDLEIRTRVKRDEHGHAVNSTKVLAEFRGNKAYCTGTDPTPRRNARPPTHWSPKPGSR